MNSCPGAVASGHPGTTAAAIQILEAGGNAMDALVAAALAAGICEPLLTGFGGGGIATIRDASTGEIQVVDCFSRFPGRGCGLDARAFQALRVDYGPTQQIFHAGIGAAAVPGIAAGLEAIHERWGTLTRAELCAPGIRLARDGWTATAATEVVASMLAAIVQLTPRSRALFAPDGQPLRSGARVQSERMASALEDFAREGSAPFTRGRHAAALVEAFGPPHGSLSQEDLDAFSVQMRDPLIVNYRGATLYLPPPPSAGGGLLAFGLRLLERLAPQLDDRVALGRCVASVMAASNAVRAEGLDEAIFEDGVMERLLREEVLDRFEHWARDDMVPGNTTHISIIDGKGNAASYTSSNGETCGSLWPGTDFAVNNFLGEDDIHPLGFHRGPAGAPLMTMMTPSLLETADGDWVVMGTGGSNRIRTAMLQVTRSIIDDGRGVRDAVMSPRLHVEKETVHVENIDLGPTFLEAIQAKDRTLTLFKDRHLYFGGVHTVARHADGTFEAVGDPRRSGSGALAREEKG